MAVVGQHFCCILMAFAYISGHLGVFNCLSVHVASSDGIKVAAVKLD